MAYDHELHRFDQLAYQSTERLALIYKTLIGIISRASQQQLSSHSK